MNFKYFFGSLLAIPLLPFMYLDGKRIRSRVPKLPEAQSPEGIIDIGSSKTLTILMLGESTVAGVGVKTHQQGFAGTFANEIATKLQTSVRWKVYAKSGYTAKQVKTLIVPEITESNADLIIIGLGGNDAFTLNTPRIWKKNVQHLIEKLKIKYPNTAIAFTNMPPIKEFPAFTKLIKFTIGNLVEILGQELQTLTENQENIYYNGNVITIKNWTKELNLPNRPSDFFSDGVHPSKLTYQVWAKDFTNFILKQSKIKDALINPS